MAPETEGKYNDKFWMQLDGVCNALDNLDARLYIDSRCVNFNKPLLESGTLGTMGNNLTCIPGVTLNYGAGPRPTEHKFPVCVVHGFPYNVRTLEGRAAGSALTGCHVADPTLLALGKGALRQPVQRPPH